MALFSWLGDLVAQLLEREGTVAPQRRRWNLRGNGWDIRDDPVNERLDVYIDGEEVVQQDMPETFLVIGDDLAAAHDFLRELRRGIDENAGNVSLVGDIQSPDGFHTAAEGDGLAAIEARVTALTIDEPSAIVILAGRNDVDGGDSASQIAAAYTSLLVAIRAKWARSRVIIGDPTRWYSPAANFAAKTAVVEALYLLMPTVADIPRTVYVPTGSLLDEDRIAASGSLPNTRGYALLANAFIPAIQNAIPPIYGRKDPRAFNQRASQPTKAHKLQRLQASRIQFPSPATNAGDLTVAFWFYPDTILKEEHIVAQSAASFFLIAENRDLILRSGNGAALDVVASDALTAQQWHRIAIVLEAGRMRFYVNGRLRGLETEAGDHNWSVTDVVLIGEDGTLEPSAVGWFADVVFSDAAMSDQESQGDYRDATGVPRNVIARYLLADLTDEMGGAAAGEVGVDLSSHSPLLPGEEPFVDSYSPEEDSDLTHWWRADMGIATNAAGIEAWYDQMTIGGAIFQDINTGFPVPVRGEGSPFNGKDALSFSSSADATTAMLNRWLRALDTFDFLNEHGYAICFALMKHGSEDGVVLSNKIAVADLAAGFRLSIVLQGTNMYARVNIGNSVTATILSGTADQTMRVGVPDLISFRFANTANHWRLETVKGVATGPQDNAPAPNAGSNTYLGADSPALTADNFRGLIAEAAIFQNATVATLDASVTAWRAYAEKRYRVRAT